jgi:signal transduction histidine kinase
MKFIKQDHQIGARLQSTGWIIDARWYYVWLAFFLVIISRNTAEIHHIAIIIAILAAVLACNTYFYLFLRRSDPGALPASTVNLLNAAQIGLDLSFFFVVMLLTGGGVESIGHSFFFIPIIVSVILFGFVGAITVATLSGILVLISVLSHAGFFTLLLTYGPGSISLSTDLSFALTQAGIIFLIYLLTGFFGGYITRLIKGRDLLLLEKIKKEEEHVLRLEELTREFDMSAKLLVRRDLDLSSVNEKLLQLDRMKSDIISIVAHQLRTPLSAIKWTLKILVDGDAGSITPEQRELLTKGFESNERMITLINDMLEVDRLESGKLTYNFAAIQFEELVQEMISDLIPLATQRSIRMEFVSSGQLLPKIKIDPEKMREVLQNLIDNAIKYTRERGTILIGVDLQGEELHFWVKDDGIGIPDEGKDKIFARFYRADNAIHAATDGSGLGLFIAQSVVKRHGGKILFESTLDVGTTFHVLLPFSS